MSAGALRVVWCGALDVWGQMALDEALAEGMAEGAWARIYVWDGTGATFGYGQRWREVREEIPAALRERATRRLTGGGVVLHDADVTFSAGFAVDGAWNPVAVYARLHGAILDRLCAAGLAAAACAPGGGSSTAPHPGGPMVCFRDPVAMDLLDPAGRKILGGAMRRHGGRVLYQGSLRTPGGRADSGWAGTAVLEGLAVALGLEGLAETDGAPWKAQARDGAARYSTRAWIERR